MNKREQKTVHVPVMLTEVMNYLSVKPGRNFVDATLGGGGYAREILKRSCPDGRLLGIDLNEDAISGGAVNFGESDEVRLVRPEPHQSDPATFSERLKIIHGNFRDIESVVHSNNFSSVDGVVFDLGLSSDLLESSGRGFSYLKNEPLIMTYSKEVSGIRLTAREVVNGYSEPDLARIFKNYSEESNSKKIARAIVESRKIKKIKTTFDLLEIIDSVSSSPKTRSRIFQAIRIEVNDEIENIKLGLAGAWKIIEAEGRLVVVSFHSAEDRVVKKCFRKLSTDEEADILTKKPITPKKEEVELNKKARSAKLRAIKKI